MGTCIVTKKQGPGGAHLWSLLIGCWLHLGKNILDIICGSPCSVLRQNVNYKWATVIEEYRKHSLSALKSWTQHDMSVSLPIYPHAIGAFRWDDKEGKPSFITSEDVGKPFRAIRFKYIQQIRCTTNPLSLLIDRLQMGYPSGTHLFHTEMFSYDGMNCTIRKAVGVA